MCCWRQWTISPFPPVPTRRHPSRSDVRRHREIVGDGDRAGAFPEGAVASRRAVEKPACLSSRHLQSRRWPFASAPICHSNVPASANAIVAIWFADVVLRTNFAFSPLDDVNHIVSTPGLGDETRRQQSGVAVGRSGAVTEGLSERNDVVRGDARFDPVAVAAVRSLPRRACRTEPGVPVVVDRGRRADIDVRRAVLDVNARAAVVVDFVAPHLDVAVRLQRSIIDAVPSQGRGFPAGEIDCAAAGQTRR